MQKGTQFSNLFFSLVVFSVSVFSLTLSFSFFLPSIIYVQNRATYSSRATTPICSSETGMQALLFHSCPTCGSSHSPTVCLVHNPI